MCKISEPEPSPPEIDTTGVVGRQWRDATGKNRRRPHYESHYRWYWVIECADGTTYQPTDLPRGVQEEGLGVHFTANRRDPQAPADPQWVLIDIVDIVC